MERRKLLTGSAAATLLLGAAALLPGHTPYRQWVVYRKRHLLILASKQDKQAYTLSRALAGHLAAILPASRARPSRAANSERMASLLSTGQMDVAVLTPAEAGAMRAGEGPSQGYGPIDLRLLLELDDRHLLVARAAFPAAHAYRVGKALDLAPDQEALPGLRLPREGAVLALHPGIAAYIDGQPEPELVEDADAEIEHEHHGPSD